MQCLKEYYGLRLTKILLFYVDYLILFYGHIILFQFRTVFLPETNLP